MNEQEKDYLDLRLAEQAILKESLDEKNARLRDLDSEVHYLRNLLNGLLAAPRLQPQAQPAAAAVRTAKGPVPQRWRA